MIIQKKSKKFPSALWALVISAFGIGTTELVVVGLLSTIAEDLSISISYTGLIVVLYALGVAIGGPVLTALTSKIRRKKLLLYTMFLFIIGNTIAAIAPSFFVLIIGRILSGASHGVFFAIGATIAGNLVSEDRRASAISIMFAGLTMAMVTGVPLGTLIGQYLGWRVTFIGVALLGVIGFVTILLLLSGNNIPLGKPLKLIDQVKVLKNKSILLVLFITVFSFAGTFTTFTYLSPILETISGFSIDSISILLLVYGAAIVLGNLIGGRLSNKNPVKALMIMFLFQAIVLFLMALAIPFKIPVVITLFFMGFLGFSNVPGLQFYIVNLAEKHLPGTEDIASALNIAAFNVGIALGAYTGGIVVDSVLTITAVPWVGGLFATLAFLLSYSSYSNNKKTFNEQK